MAWRDGSHDWLAGHYSEVGMQICAIHAFGGYVREQLKDGPVDHHRGTTGQA
jgi:hypothetical protein